MFTVGVPHGDRSSKIEMSTDSGETEERRRELDGTKAHMCYCGLDGDVVIY